jgi:hypothetical protein
MRLELEVLDLAVEILRDEARLAGTEAWEYVCTDVADRLADIIDHLDQDG